MNEYLIQHHQEAIQRQVRVSHLEQFIFEQALLSFLKRFRPIPKSIPLALTSADAACACLF